MNDKDLAKELTRARQSLGEWIEDNLWSADGGDINFLEKLEDDMFKAVQLLESPKRYKA